MTDSNIFKLNKPDQSDPLQEVLREGARKMLAAAIEAEVSDFIKQHGSLKTDEGELAVVRNGYLPARPIQTGLGDIVVKVPKVRDRCESGIKFNSSLVPPYLKRAKNIEEFLPWLYLKGISTGDFSESLKHFLGPDSPGLSHTSRALGPGSACPAPGAASRYPPESVRGPRRDRPAWRITRVATPR